MAASRSTSLTNLASLVLGGAGAALYVAARLRRKETLRQMPYDELSSPRALLIIGPRVRVAVALALEAGQAMLDAKACSAQDQGREGGVSYKGRHDLVTETDRSNEALIQRGLKQAFPQDRFLGEETSAAAAAAETANGVGGATPLKAVEDGVEMVWIVDPIDGTTNFVHGFPVTCVSIALATRGEVIVGVVYNPFTKELYQSVKGNGSFLNGDPLEASGKTKMDQAMVVAEYSCVREEESISTMMKTTGSIACTARAVRQTGCGAMDLCFLARGAVDAVFGGVAGVWKPWDWAAGVLIAKEAGAVILAGDGGQFRLMGDTILGAATPELASSLTSQLNAL